MLTPSPQTEGDYNRAEQDIRRDEQEVENIPENVANATEEGFDNAVQDVEDIPSDIGSMVKEAANWIGDKIGGIEGEGRRAENEVNQFDQSVENSFDQGEQEGEYRN